MQTIVNTFNGYGCLRGCLAQGFLGNLKNSLFERAK